MISDCEAKTSSLFQTMNSLLNFPLFLIDRNLNPPKGVLYTSKLYSTSTRRRASRSAGVLRATSADAGVMKEEEWTDSPWPPRNAPCFNLMNSFMERYVTGYLGLGFCLRPYCV